MDQSKTKKEAEQKAEVLRSMMDTPDNWLIEVWENLGWHYRIYHKKGYIEVSCSNWDGKRSYSTGFNPEARGKKPSGTPTEYYLQKHFDNPNEAVAAQLSHVRRIQIAINESLGIVFDSLENDGILAEMIVRRQKLMQKLVGRTIAQIDATADNELIIKFETGKSLRIEGDVLNIPSAGSLGVLRYAEFKH